MFVIRLHYKESLTVVDQYIEAHRAFLEDGYHKNFFIASGPQNPRTGGIILSQLTDRNQLSDILSQDPFAIHHIADYEIIEFIPLKYHPNFAYFVEM